MEVEYPIDRFFLDFAIPNKKIAIECDGKKFHNNFDKERSTEKTNKDYARNTYLQIRGWRIVRFTGSQIVKNPIECVRTILKIKLVT